ncbi:MAG: rRNA maturation RNase YbeY [Bacteroidales bacterium]|nr:rRNA maturation RNase YbeY [Bacteroidales bacterium]
MNIVFFNEDVEMPGLNFDKVILWISKIIEDYKKIVGDINYIFCSDEYLLQINREYLNHDFYTDIVTFNSCEGSTISGDIFISIDRVTENAEEYNTQDSEIFRVIIHGVLHLVGLDDHSEKEKSIMRKAEDDALEMAKNEFMMF